MDGVVPEDVRVDAQTLGVRPNERLRRPRDSRITSPSWPVSRKPPRPPGSRLASI